MFIASTCIQGKMEVELEMFHCDRAHLFALRSSALASQYIMRLCCKANIWVDYGQSKLVLEVLQHDLTNLFPFLLSFLHLGSCTGGGTSCVGGHGLGGMKSSMSSS